MQSQSTLKICITIGALVVTVIHISMPSIKIDSITLILLVVAVLPWLQPVLKTLKLPGGFEVTLQELKQEVKAAAGAAQSAERKADLAISDLTESPSHGSPPRIERAPHDVLLDLAQRYEEIRRSHPSGPLRTQAMTEVVREMISLAPSLQGLDLQALLKATTGGQRLAAYAYLYAKPDPSMLAALVHSSTVIEDKPFGQYWALQAIGRNIPERTSAVSENVIQALKAFAHRVPSGTDRDYEIRRILNLLPSDAAV